MAAENWTFRRTLMLSFCVLVLAIGAVTGYLGAVIIGNRVYTEAQNRVASNLLVTRIAFDARIDQILTTSRICAQRIVTRSALEGRDVDQARRELEHNRVRNRLDFLTLVDVRGTVVLRTAPPASVRLPGPVRAVTSAARPLNAIGALTTTCPAKAPLRAPQSRIGRNGSVGSP